MSKAHLRKILRLINKDISEYEIRKITSNKMDIGLITEDESVIIDFSLQERTNKFIGRLTKFTR